MSVFRVDKSRDYTVVSNNIFKDRTLSAKAKGILVEMLSLPEDWDYTLKGLTYLFSDGLDSIRKGIQELEEHGYVVRQRMRDEKGRLGGTEYVIYETPRKAENSEPESEPPVFAMPAEDSPAAEKPTQASTTQLNINKSNTKKSITYESNPNQSAEPMDVMGYEEACETVMENIEYDVLRDRYSREWLDEIVELAAEALCSRRATFRYGDDVYPQKLVRERLLKLRGEHIVYIHDCLSSSSSEIRNIKPYMMKTLINAPATYESYYNTKANYVMRE